MENSIFISYSHKDIASVNKIVEVMKKASQKPVWYDSNLRGGDYYFSEIANQIIQSTHFVFIVSDNSINSDWCLRELEFAASERKIIIAIWLDNISIPPRVKLVIQNTHYINYYTASNEDFFNSLSKVFLNDAPQQYRNYHTDSGSQDSIWNETYFLDAEKLKMIEGLLSKEKKNVFSVCFQAENAYLLGLAYELGIGVEADLKKAQFYYKISDYKGSYEGKYLYAAIRAEQEDANKANLFSEMLDAAEHHSIFALTYHGDDYYYGRNGCDIDKDKAYAFWKQAADGGGVVAMYYMAYGYRVGECVEKDPELSYMYTLMAVEHGFPRAYRLLGYMYEDGDYFEKDYGKAIEMFEEAFKRGDYLSLCYEGWVYGELDNYKKKRELYEKAVRYAESGKIKSGTPFFRMGYILETGEGIPKDVIKSVEYYLLAAERKHEKALKYTVETIMTIPDSEKRDSFLRKAFEFGCNGAAYELGMIEKSKGEGERLSDEAVKYFKNGANSGSINCILQLLWNYSFVIGHGDTREDRLEAIKWFQLFFALSDDDFLKDFPNLETYYYAYAIELDYDPDYNMPDREFVQMYFKKSLDVSLLHYYQIVHFIVNGYLFPEDSSSGLQLDILHAVEMLKLLEGYLSDYLRYLNDSEKTDTENRWYELLQQFERGYIKISECYSKGVSVSKDKAMALEYKKKANRIELEMQRTAKVSD